MMASGCGDDASRHGGEIDGGVSNSDGQGGRSTGGGYGCGGGGGSSSGNGGEKSSNGEGDDKVDDFVCALCLQQ